MKIAPLLIILYIALIGIIIFDGIGTSNWTTNPYEGGSVASDPGDSAIWNLFTDPTSWKNNSLISLITITFLTAAAAITVAILTKSDIAFLTPLFVVIINAGILPIVAIYQVVFREILRMTCNGDFNAEPLIATCIGGSGTTGAILITAICVGPIAVAWVLACIEWWTQRPTS